MEWFRKASAQGSLIALMNIGSAYYLGEGVTQSYSKAFAWYYVAAIRGNEEAQFLVGDLYERGIGTERSLLNALEYYGMSYSNYYGSKWRYDRLVKDIKEMVASCGIASDEYDDFIKGISFLTKSA